MLPQLLLITLSAQQLIFNGQPITLSGATNEEVSTGEAKQTPASICIGKAPRQACYIAPKEYWIAPKAEIIQIDKSTNAILFTAESYGAPGWAIHIALLIQESENKLVDLFFGHVDRPNQGQHRFFSDTKISPAPIFLTASYIWSIDEGRTSPHRYMISSYLWRYSENSLDHRYVLSDSYMTTRAYSSVDEGFDILTAEAPEWKSRLHRVLANTPPTESENRGFTYYLTGSPANAPSPQPTKPGYLLAGGGKDQDAAFLWFLERANHGDILILRGSGADGYHPYLSKLSPKLDSIESIVFQEAKSTSDPFVLERIRQADAIFLAGGNQWNYERLWRNTPVQRELDAAIKRGIPIGGTSAGLAVLSEFGFTAQHGGITSEEAAANPNQPKIAIERGLLNIPALTCLITDSHFTQRQREGRLRVFLQNIEATKQCQHPPIGLGIDERTALLLEPEGTGTVVGEGAVHVYANPKAQPISIRKNETLDLKQLRPKATPTNP